MQKEWKMPKDLSDAELVKLVRGDVSQVAFAEKLGVAQSMLSDWERGAVKPRRDTWIKMARLATGGWTFYCWDRAGLNAEDRMAFIRALRTGNEPESSADLLKAKVLLAPPADLGILSEKIKLFLDDLSLVSRNDTIAKHKILAAHEELSPMLRTLQGAEESNYAAEMLEALEHAARAVAKASVPADIHAAVSSLQWTLRQKPSEQWYAQHDAPCPVKLVAGESKAPAAAKKAKRERRRKK